MHDIRVFEAAARHGQRADRVVGVFRLARVRRSYDAVLLGAVFGARFFIGELAPLDPDIGVGVVADDGVGELQRLIAEDAARNDRIFQRHRARRASGVLAGVLALQGIPGHGRTGGGVVAVRIAVIAGGDHPRYDGRADEVHVREAGHVVQSRPIGALGGGQGAAARDLIRAGMRGGGLLLGGAGADDLLRLLLGFLDVTCFEIAEPGVADRDFGVVINFTGAAVSRVDVADLDAPRRGEGAAVLARRLFGQRAGGVRVGRLGALALGAAREFGEIGDAVHLYGGVIRRQIDEARVDRQRARRGGAAAAAFVESKERHVIEGVGRFGDARVVQRAADKSERRAVLDRRVRVSRQRGEHRAVARPPCHIPRIARIRELERRIGGQDAVVVHAVRARVHADRHDLGGAVQGQSAVRLAGDGRALFHDVGLAVGLVEGVRDLVVAAEHGVDDVGRRVDGDALVARKLQIDGGEGHGDRARRSDLAVGRVGVLRRVLLDGRLDLLRAELR